MKKEIIIPFAVAIIVFAILTAGYEYFIYLWSLNKSTPVIRVDIFLIYPIILSISLLVFLGIKKLLKKGKKKKESYSYKGWLNSDCFLKRVISVTLYQWLGSLLLSALILIIIFILTASIGIYKFNYLSSLDGYDVDGNKIIKNYE